MAKELGGESCPLRRHKVKSVLAQARAHYKKMGKSSNKFYNDTAKAIRRNQIREGSGGGPPLIDYIRLLRDQYAGGLTMQQEGLYLVDNNMMYGNYWEMAAAALQKCRHQFGAGVSVFTASVQPPGDHIFLVLSAGGSPSPRLNAYQLSRANPANFRVIDCWANVACSVNDYPISSE